MREGKGRKDGVFPPEFVGGKMGTNLFLPYLWRYGTVRRQLPSLKSEYVTYRHVPEDTY